MNKPDDYLPFDFVFSLAPIDVYQINPVIA
jgi:hypothetical protein